MMSNSEANVTQDIAAESIMMFVLDDLRRPAGHKIEELWNEVEEC